MRKLLLTVLFFIALKSYCQDTTFKFTYTIDTSFFTKYSSINFQPSFNYIYHLPDKKDRQLFKNYKYLIGQKPTLKNHELYYSLACSLWELEKIAEAEKMFLTIVNSAAKYYTGTYYHSSDISGDTTKNIYGYGSFTSNYKNYAAIYLTKIYLEQKKFDKALQFLEDAVKKYAASYTCGTGYNMQKNEYDFLYASCYEGLNRHTEVIDLLLPSCLSRSDEIIIAAIKKTYSNSQIQAYLQKAEASIKCTLDSFPSFRYRTTYNNTNEEKTDTIKYYSGEAVMLLFDREINVPVPNLENGEHLSRDRFIALFKESDFYTRLKEGN